MHTTTLRLEEGRTYTASEWDDLPRDQFVPGDRWTTTHTVTIGPDGDPDYGDATFTITHLAPRTPSWAGAQVVRDKDGVEWVKHEGVVWRSGIMCRSTATLERYAPITILRDADGNIPVDTVMQVNQVGRDDLVNVAMGESLDITYAESARIVDAVLAALEGGR